MTGMEYQLNTIIRSLNDLQHADRAWMESEQAQCIATLLIAVADLAQVVGEQQEQIKTLQKFATPSAIRNATGTRNF